jgi:hypothetical protein
MASSAEDGKRRGARTLWARFLSVLVTAAAIGSGCALDEAGTCTGPCASPDAQTGADVGTPDTAAGPETGSKKDAGTHDARPTHDAQKDQIAPADSSPPPGCAGDPETDPTLVTDAKGIFVSLSGSDTNPGTQASPVESITKGINLAAAMKLCFVFVCTGTFTETVDFATNASGVGLFGGFQCGSGWAAGGAPTQVVATTDQGALNMNKVSYATIEDFAFEGFAPTAAGDSSIAVAVYGSTNVTFKDVSMTAQNATTGSGGTMGNNYSGGVASDGNPATAGSGTNEPGPAVTCACNDASSSTGGAGGPSGDDGDNGTPSLGGGMGGALEYGGQGGDGSQEISIAAGATVPGMISSSNTWVGTSGTNGANAGAAQGGGGGGGSEGNAGGGGACGGCGGAGGSGGQSGGSSIALLVSGSTVTLNACKLTAGNAGDGGNGGPGQDGQDGGTGADGCCGGNEGGGGGGGGGAGGGGGGGGAGGYSVALVQHASTITGLGTCTANYGNAGMRGSGGGNGGNGGYGGPGNSGSMGAATHGTAGSSGTSGTAGAAGEAMDGLTL